MPRASRVRSLYLLVASLATLASLLLLPTVVAASVDIGHANTTTLSQGLVGYWTFDGSTINWATGQEMDSSGKGNTGLLVGMSTTTSPLVGRIGQALNFNGSSYMSLITVPGTLSAGGTPTLSISAWVRRGSASGGGAIVNYSPQYAFDIGVTPCTGSQIKVTKYSVADICIGTFPSDTKFHLLTAVWSSTGVNVYIDGVLSGTSVNVSNFSGTTSGVFGVGYDSADHVYFSGTIDDVRIYNRALSPQEVSMLYALGEVQAGNSLPTSTDSKLNIGLDVGLVGEWIAGGNTINWATGLVQDVSGSGNNGQMTGMSTSTSPRIGAVGQALTFNGSTSYITTGYTIPAQSSATSFTWSGWMKIGTGNIGTVVILGFRTGTSWVKVTPSAFEYNGVLIAHVLPIGSWVYVSVVKNGSNFTYYQNGAVIGTASSSGTVASHTFYLGADPGYPSDGTFSGTLDDVRVYNRALSVQEINDLYDAGKVTVAHSTTSSSGTGLNAGLVGYWTFDGPTINWATGVIQDMSGSGNNLQMTGMSTTTSPTIGKVGQALKFNGSTQSASHSNISAFNFGTGDFSVSFWVKPVSPWGTATTVALIGQKSGDGTNGWQIYQDSGHAGYLDIRITQQNNFLTVSTIPLGQWTYATFVRKGGNTYWYLNGSLNASGTNSASISDATGLFEIGYAQTWSAYYPGTLDDVRIYNRALSSQEVQQLYLIGK